MTSPEARAIEAAGTVRRALAMYNAEVAEFAVAVQSGDIDLMEAASRRLHEYLDVYLDSIVAARACEMSIARGT